MIALIAYSLAFYIGWKIGELILGPVNTDSHTKKAKKHTDFPSIKTNGLDFLYVHPEAR